MTSTISVTEDEIDDYRVVKLFHQDKKRNNAVKSNKYNWYDFVPKNLFEQFSQLGNMYFMLVAVGQLFPSISNTKGKPATLVPLSGVVVMQAIKDLFEDWQRIASDQKENSNLATAVDANMAERSIEWGQIRPGMVLKIRNEERIPADCLLLTSSHADGHCCVETANLDGETNLKKKTAALTPAELESAAQNVRFVGVGAAPCLRCEPPSGDLYAFRSSLELTNGEVRGLGVSTLLLRGTSLQQTEWVLGMVVYAGHDTRTLKNSRSARFKPSALDVRLNGVVAMIFAIQMSICLFISLSSFLWQSLHGHKVWYLEGLPQYLNPLRQVGIWFLMLNSMVPISLMITVTVVKFAQGKIMSQDEGCGSNGKNAEVHTSQVIDSLGQVTHVFSDKTGTLTQNVMEYRACSVGGRIYGLEGNPSDEEVLQDAHVNLPAGPLLSDLRSSGSHADIMASFVLCHALCHTVEPADSAAGEAPYNASSPDELALVCAARAIGLEFLRLSPEGVLEVLPQGAASRPLVQLTGWCPEEGKLLKAQLLDVCEFDNNRKRMSVVVRLPNGQIML
ncbi:Atp8b5, partial [Symbiodinium sp. CCMP2456]